ncbi:expressed unknown protein [Seminavis robusta]|uniref:Uncharacterized protein n=1 Tax=Seminavis robusta TaxID=568900 RepID=A0A9N8DXH1_9STRA|nr:expressed unknown protein [Seminavis robusta]|eukprot:Sro450_g145520.1 n/a (273) ;mRNA; r:19068-19886
MVSSDLGAASSDSKFVTFQPTITIVRFHELRTAAERWHSIPDRRRFIQQAREEAQHWIDKGCYEFLLKDSFHEGSDELAQARMNAYAQLPGEDYCRGLERHVCREHGLKRDSFKKGAIRAIVNEGRKRRDAGMPLDKSWYQLGEISRKLSFLAARFARRVGTADEIVVRLGEDASKVDRLRMDADPIQKLRQHREYEDPALESPVKKTKEICVGASGETSVGEHQALQVQRQNNHSAQCAITATGINGWCHGPRESIINVPGVNTGGISSDC